MITFSTERLLDLYQDQGYLNLLIDEGLLSESMLLRGQFKDALEFVSFKIKQGGLPESPSIFFLRVLINKLQVITTSKNSMHTF